MRVAAPCRRFGGLEYESTVYLPGRDTQPAPCTPPDYNGTAGFLARDIDPAAPLATRTPVQWTLGGGGVEASDPAGVGTGSCDDVCAALGPGIVCVEAEAEALRPASTAIAAAAAPAGE